jgi:hypothetical protein
MNTAAMSFLLFCGDSAQQNLARRMLEEGLKRDEAREAKARERAKKRREAQKAAKTWT